MTPGGVIEGLGLYRGGVNVSRAEDVSADGTVITGYYQSFFGDAGGAFRWTETGGIELLGATRTDSAKHGSSTSTQNKGDCGPYTAYAGRTQVVAEARPHSLFTRPPGSSRGGLMRQGCQPA